MSWQLSQSRAARKAALKAAGYKCARCGHISKSGKGLVVQEGGTVLCSGCINQFFSKLEDTIAVLQKPDLEARNKDWYAWVYGGARNPQT